MIQKNEIMQHANKLNLNPNTIEKDYALNWLLAGIGSNPQLKISWVFKGGTCLKKCYFKNYRFSEDLDFTMTDTTLCNKEALLSIFAEISD